MTVVTSRLKGISRKGRKITPSEQTRYGKSAMLRYFADEPIYPIGYVQHKFASKSTRSYVENNDEWKVKLIGQSLYGSSIEYVDNRISLYSAQKRRCAVTVKNSLQRTKSTATTKFRKPKVAQMIIKI